jgi:hypothetical protein
MCLEIKFTESKPAAVILRQPRSQGPIVLIVSLSMAIFASASHTNAGWLGPDNFAECMVDAMRGQVQAMAELAAQACSAKFPASAPPPTEVLLDENNSTVRWDFCSDAEQSPIKICIIQEPDNYRITKVVGHFSNNYPCNRSADHPVYLNGVLVEKYTTILGEKAWLSETYSFNGQGAHNCSYVSFFGFNQ